jgi:hypothetical protein
MKYPKTILETKRSDEKTLLEVEKEEKEFHFVQVTVERYWKREAPPHSHMTQQFGVTTHKLYELYWRNKGSEKIGRTELWDPEGKPMQYKQAVKTFFQALEASENMQFREL